MSVGFGKHVVLCGNRPTDARPLWFIGTSRNNGGRRRRYYRRFGRSGFEPAVQPDDQRAGTRVGRSDQRRHDQESSNQQEDADTNVPNAEKEATCWHMFGSATGGPWNVYSPANI